ncbi:MAG: hypothetical protein AAB839_00075 [Patescibacteria group bacterium]
MPGCSAMVDDMLHFWVTILGIVYGIGALFLPSDAATAAFGVTILMQAFFSHCYHKAVGAAHAEQLKVLKEAVDALNKT